MAATVAACYLLRGINIVAADPWYIRLLWLLSQLVASSTATVQTLVNPYAAIVQSKLDSQQRIMYIPVSG